LIAGGATVRHHTQGAFVQAGFLTWAWSGPAGHAPTQSVETGYGFGSERAGWRFFGGFSFNSRAPSHFFASLRVGDPAAWIEVRTGRWNSFLDPRSEVVSAGTNLTGVDVAIWGGRVVHFEDTSWSAAFANRNELQRLTVPPGAWQWGGGLDLVVPLTESVDGMVQFVAAREPSATLGLRATFGGSETSK